MKNSIKIAIVLILLGAILVVGAIAGGADISINAIRELNVSGKKINLEFEPIQAVQIDVSNYSVEIVPSKDNKTKVVYNETMRFGKTHQSLDVKVEDGILKIVDINQEKVRFNFSFFILNKNTNIVISVPEDLVGQIKLSAGSFEAKDIALSEMEVEAEMGSINLVNAKVVNSKFEAKMGSLNVKNSICENINLNTEMGSIDYSGVLLGNNDFSTEMGSIDLKLEQKRDDIALNLKTSMGNVMVDETKGSINEEKSSTKSYLKAETEMGSIDIDFED